MCTIWGFQFQWLKYNWKNMFKLQVVSKKEYVFDQTKIDRRLGCDTRKKVWKKIIEDVSFEKYRFCV